jgi:hypothetical protein
MCRRPTNYSGKAARKADFYVDTNTGRLVRIEFTDESRQVVFSDFGKVPQLTQPQNTMTNAQASKLVGQ